MFNRRKIYKENTF